MATRSRLAATGSLLGISALLFAGCGAAPEESSSSDKAKSDFKACVISDEGGFDDKSFNENSYNGVKAAEKDYGIEMAEAESESAADFNSNMTKLVQNNCNIIISVGFLLADTTKQSAAENPDVHYAIVDDGTIEANNVRPIIYDTAQAAFQAGYLAASQSKTGKVATYGGIEIPTVTIFTQGFEQGVKYYNEQKGKDVKVLGMESFVGNFSDQSKGKTLTQSFLDQGADVIMPVAGPVGAGTLEAVTEYNKSHSDAPASVIWVDADGHETNPNHQDIILTSVQKKMKEAVESTIKDDIDGKFSSEKYIGTLKNDGVGLAPFYSFDDKVSSETKTELDQIKKDIIDGKITVKTDGTPTK